MYIYITFVYIYIIYTNIYNPVDNSTTSSHTGGEMKGVYYDQCSFMYFRYSLYILLFKFINVYYHALFIITNTYHYILLAPPFQLQLQHAQDETGKRPPLDTSVHDSCKLFGSASTVTCFRNGPHDGFDQEGCHLTMPPMREGNRRCLL